MYNLIKAFLIVLFFVSTIGSEAQVTISEQTSGSQVVPLVAGSNAAVVYDDKDYEVVKKSASLFVNDIYLVTGKHLKSATAIPPNQKNVIIVGTIGKNKYVTTLVSNPVRGVKSALVIAGCDRRVTEITKAN